MDVSFKQSTINQLKILSDYSSDFNIIADNLSRHTHIYGSCSPDYLEEMAVSAYQLIKHIENLNAVLLEELETKQ